MTYTMTASGNSSSSGDVVVMAVKTGSTTSANQSQSQTVTGGANELRAAVQSSLDSGGSLRNQITSVLTLYNTQVTLPKPPDAPPETPTVVVPARSTIPRNCVIYCRDCWIRRPRAPGWK